MAAANALQAIATQVAEAGSVALDWNPPDCGALDMRISRDGVWHYQGSPVAREALVRLFAGILRLEQGRYYLVSPVEKFSIEVELLPFVSQTLEIQGEGLHQEVVLFTNTGEQLTLDDQHPLEFVDAGNGEQLPCVPLGRGLRVLLQRSHYYQLVERALEQAGDDEQYPVIYSRGRAFALHPESDSL
ncbi:MAG: DUF1285 domain-containing protein [Thiopseudomonas sp.]|nr:DUF1285 domain-containing protein [Gammaproteobacteria bacterium]